MSEEPLPVNSTPKEIEESPLFTLKEPESIGKPRFRQDIEGLRGVAILLVLLFHASIPGFNGGFFGVDMFYVISGYLITGLLIRERAETGTISLRTFYARRIRRLLPMATLVLFSTLVASYFLAPRLLMPSIAFDIAAASLFLSNMNFAHHATDYFASSAPSPALHFWSLSVEEQYYMLWPVLALLFTRTAKSISLRIFFSLLLLGSFSFWFALWLLNKNQSWAFFSLPSRAWELALGGLIASSSVWLDKIPNRVLLFMQWIASATIIYALITLRQSDPFPVWPALIPTLATAMFLIAGKRSTSIARSFKDLPKRFLETPLMRYLGKISYSLYLWHWPLFIIASYHYRDGIPFSTRVLLIYIALGLSILSFHFVEDPLRHGYLLGKNPIKNIATGIVAVFVVATASLALSAYLNSVAQSSIKHSPTLANVQLQSPKKRIAKIVRPTTQDFPLPAGLTPSLLTAENDRALTYADRCHTQQNLLPSMKACLYGDLLSTKTIVLFGDSHALQWFPALDKVAITNHWRLLSLTMSACTPSDIPAWDRVAGKVMQNCALWRQESIAKIIATKPYLILVAGTRGFVTLKPKGKVAVGAEATSLWEAGIHRTLTQLKTASSHVIMIMDTPLSIYDPKICLSENPKSTLACATPVDKAISSSWQIEEGKVAKVNQIGLIDPSLWVCPSAPCPVVIGDVLVYLDAGHLTATYSSTLATVLGESIKTFLKGNPTPALKAKKK